MLAYEYLVYLFPLLAVSGLAIALFFGDRKKRGLYLILLLFMLAALAGAWPRFDAIHLLYTVFFSVAGLAAIRVEFRGRLSPALQRNSLRAFYALLIPGILYQSGMIFSMFTSPAWQCPDRPHFRHIYFQAADWRKRERQAGAIAALAPERPFILSAQAGFYYLAANLKNPTPFDFPLVTAFGRNGEQELIAGIRKGWSVPILYDPYIEKWGPMQPLRLQTAIKSAMRPDTTLGKFVLYR